MHTGESKPDDSPRGSSERLTLGASASELLDSAWNEGEIAVQEAIRETIAANPDKEPFNYQKFAELYWKKDMHEEDHDESSEIEEYHRQQYYLSFQSSNTIEDYARELEELDAQAGN